MEPAVIDGLQLASLFQTGVLVVDEVHQLLVVADDTQFTGRDVDVVEGDVVETQFLNLMTERYLAPDVVFRVSLADARQAFLRRAVVDDGRQVAPDTQGHSGVVVLLDHQRVGRAEDGELGQGCRIGTPG